MIPDDIPLDTGSVLIGITELAEDERRAAIQFPLLRNDELAHHELESVIECRGEGERAVGSEVVEPSEKILSIDGQPSPLHTAVRSQHSVSGADSNYRFFVVLIVVVRFRCENWEVAFGLISWSGADHPV